MITEGQIRVAIEALHAYEDGEIQCDDVLLDRLETAIAEAFMALPDEVRVPALAPDPPLVRSA